MVENYNKINKVQIDDSGRLILHKDIATKLVGNFVIQNIAFFSKNNEFRLRIYKEEDFFSLLYVKKITKSNQFIQKNTIRLRSLMYSLQSYKIDTISKGIKLPKRMLSLNRKGALLEVIQHNGYIDIKRQTL